MYLPSSLLLSLSLLLLTTPPPTNPQGIKRPTRCHDHKSQLFPPLRFTELATALTTHHPGETTRMPPDTFFHYESGILLVCVHNDWIRAETYISRNEVGEAVDAIREECCRVEEAGCAGGYHQAHGDDGLFVDVYTKMVGEMCW